MPAKNKHDETNEKEIKGEKDEKGENYLSTYLPSYLSAHILRTYGGSIYAFANLENGDSVYGAISLVIS